MSNWKAGDRVRVLSCPANPSLEGMTGFLVKTPAIGGVPLLRVRLDGGTGEAFAEVDGTEEKFEKIPSVRLVTKEQLADGFWIRLPSGEEVHHDFSVIRELPGDVFEVREP